MQATTDFEQNVNNFLNSLNTIQQVDFVASLLSGRKKEIRTLTISTTGPCIRCEAIQLQYEPSDYHRRTGDKYLASLLKRFKKLKFSIYDRRPLINGTRFETISGYLCPRCVDEIVRCANDYVKECDTREQEAEERRRKKRARHPTPWDLHNDRLSVMPYNEFLQTEYWKSVRQMMIRAARFRCELCSAKDKLHLHHKTYDHRGYEHLHLEDLIVLCERCHRIHHGKEGVA